MKRLLALMLVMLMTMAVWADTYVVCVGIGNYKDTKVENLKKTEADAKAMADFFKRGTENVITITGKYATKSQIVKSLKSQFFQGEGRRSNHLLFQRPRISRWVLPL